MIFTQELKCDIYRYGRSEIIKSLFYKVLTNSEATFMFLYRMCNNYKTNSVRNIISYLD
jgi:hypothetical protein